MKNPQHWILSYDVGGSHVSAGLVRFPNLDLVGVQSVSIDSSLSSGQVMGTFAALGRAVINGQAQPKIAGIATSMPGPFDYERGICYIRGLAKYEQLYGVDFRAALAGHFPEVDREAVRFVNDAAAALLGEIQAGAARGKQRAIGLTLGTGIGAAFAVSGRIVTSGPGVPPGGYIYNLPWNGGIVEDVLSSRGIRKEYIRLGGEDRDVREIAQRTSSDPLAKRVLVWFGQTLGEVVGSLVDSFHPEVIVLGGAITRSHSLFLPSALQMIRGRDVEVRPSELGERAGLIGAAVAWGLE